MLHIVRRLMAAGLLVVCPLVAGGGAWAQEAATQQAAVVADPLLDKRVSINIAAQSLAGAVVELSKAAGVQMVMAGGSLDELTTPGIRGEMSLRQALTQLLEGTGAKFRKATVDTIVIDVPRRTADAGNAASALSLNQVVADGDPLFTSADPVTSADTIPVAEARTEQPERAEDDGDSQRLDDVIVTVTKRERSLRELPQSINAFTGDELIQRGATDMSEILKFAPGVVLTDTGEGENPNITIRGIATSSEAGLEGSRTFGVFYGDAAIVNPVILGITPSIDPYDMQTVEVLKGPQGTLFGGQALSGAIRFVPNPADFKGTYGQFRYDGVRVDHSEKLGRRMSGMANLALGDAFALRFAGTSQRTAGYVDDTRNNVKDINSTHTDSGRFMMRIQPVSGVQLSAGHLVRRHFQDNSTRLNGAQDDWVVSNRRDPDTEDSTTTITDVKVDLDLSSGIGILPAWPVEVVGLFTQVKKHARVQTDITMGVAAIVAEQLDSASVIPGISVAQIVDQYLPGDLVIFNDPMITDMPTYELRFISTEPTGGWWPVRNWDYLVGLYRMESKQSLGQNYSVGPGALPVPLPLSVLPPQVVRIVPGLTLDTEGELQPAGLLGDYIGTASEDAIFFDLTRKFDYGLELNIGGRFFEVQPNVSIRTSAVDRNIVPAYEVLLDGYLEDPYKDLRKETGFNPKLALTWQANKHISLYGTRVKGFRFGGANTCIPFACQITPYPLVYRSDKLWNNEIGLRTEWFDRTLRADVTAFRIDWTDMQLQQTYRGAFGYRANIGSARSSGYEFSTQMFLPWGFNLLANAAWIDARTTEPYTLSTGSIAAGGADPDEVPAGTRLPSAPEFSSSMALGWVHNLGDWLLGANFSWTRATSTKAQLGETLEIDGYNSFSGGLKLAAPHLPLAPSIDLNAINLTDEFVIQGRTRDDIVKVARPPRTITLGLTLNFGSPQD